MNLCVFKIKCLMVLFLLIVLGGIGQVSADDKIIVKEIPDEFSQNDYIRVLVKTTYPPGSFLNYSFTLETPYPHRGKLSGYCSHGSEARISESQSVLSEKISLGEYIPGDWVLKIWEEDHEDQAYVKTIHIYPAGSGYVDEKDSGTPDICRGTSASNPNLSLDPNTEEDGGLLAKGEALYLKGEAPAESEIGVWIYSGAVNDDFPVYNKVSADCNGEVDDEILSVFDSYTLQSGKYYVYAVYKGPDLIERTGTPDRYSDFEYELDTTAGVKYQKFDLDAEDPWISIDSGNEIEAVAGTVLTFEGETNLKDGTVLEVLINPTAVDSNAFGNLITQTTTVEDNGPVNKWTYIIDSSCLGAGEYLISVESPEGLGDASCIFNIFDSSYAVKNPGDDRISVTSYKVDKDTKDLKSDSGIPVRNSVSGIVYATEVQ